MNLKTIIPVLVALLMGCNKQGADDLSTSTIDDVLPSKTAEMKILGDWKSGYRSSEWGRMKLLLTFNSNDHCSVLFLPEDTPSEPIISLDGSWNYDGFSGIISWTQSKLLSDKMTIKNNIDNGSKESFNISDDSVLRVKIGTEVVTFTKVNYNE